MKTIPILMILAILLISGCAQTIGELPVQPVEQNSEPQEISPVTDASLSSTDRAALLEAVAQQQSLAVDQLKIVKVQEADWPDACLGLAGPDEFCAQVITPGWAVELSDGQQIFKYRTNLDMSLVKVTI